MTCPLLLVINTTALLSVYLSTLTWILPLLEAKIPVPNAAAFLLSLSSAKALNAKVAAITIVIAMDLIEGFMAMFF
jgi:hypothetical protein